MKKSHYKAVGWMCFWGVAGALLDAYASLVLHEARFSGWRLVSSVMGLLALLGVLWLAPVLRNLFLYRIYRRKPSVLLAVVIAALLLFYGWRAYDGYYRDLIQAVERPD